MIPTPDPSTCPECGWSVGVPSVGANDHEKHHDCVVYGLPAGEPLVGEKTIFRGPARITAVRAGSSDAEKSRAYDALSLANAEIPAELRSTPLFLLDPGSSAGYRDPRVFLFHSGDSRKCSLRSNRILGVVVVERRRSATEFAWTATGAVGAYPPRVVPRRRTVCAAWTHRRHRRRGIARLMVETAARFFKLEPAELAWATPLNESGTALARSVQPALVLLTLD